jgi:arylsulfatase A-like enzyme
VNWAIGRLGRKYDQPFFLGVGFSLPHQPLFAPKRFHDLHPPDKVVLPPYLKTDLDDLPRSGKDYALIATTSGTHRTVVAFDQWRNAVSSYLATVSFVDYLLGRLLAALENSVHADNTWIILWSDHGWHLGEKDHWGKATGWYRATRVPLIIVPPAKRAPAGFKAGTVSNRPVNLVDLFPTVADIGRLPIPSRLDGKSLIPLIENPNATWKDFTVTTFGRGNHAVTTNRWRYIQYFDGGAELYDRENDPNEWTNLILEKRHESVIERLKAHVPEEPQWRHFIRYNNFKAVVPSDGSPMLLFNHDVENNLEERFDESADYPEVVAYIQKWTKENQPRGKRLDISDPRVR